MMPYMGANRQRLKKLTALGLCRSARQRARGAKDGMTSAPVAWRRSLHGPSSGADRPRVWPSPLLLGAVLATLATVGSCGSAGGAEAPREVTFVGAIAEPDDLSAVARFGERLILVSDEGALVQLLDPTERPGTYRAQQASIALLGEDAEIDLEGLAVRGRQVFAVGSHSVKRRRLDPDKSRSQNRKRLATVVAEPSRDGLFRLELDPATGQLTRRPERVDLRPLLEHDEILGRFMRIPGKENGVDIEGLAASADRLYLGLRSPVLRQGQVPVLVLSFDEPTRYELRFVHLGGLGIRSLARVEGGFLILAGAERTKDYRFYFWDGSDRVPGKDASPGGLTELGPAPQTPGGKPEGLAVMEETPTAYDLLVVYDGVRDGAPRRFRLPKR
jgi:hypothetical protein